MNHRYIDETSVAQRYLEHRLAPDEQAEFEAHLLGRNGPGGDGKGCDECADRLLLAQIFLDKQKLQTEEPMGWTGSRREKVENGSARGERTPKRRNGAGAATYSFFPEPFIPIPDDRLPMSEEVDALPWTARFVAQFKPWQLALILLVGAALLLLTPTAYYLWELAKLRGVR